VSEPDPFSAAKRAAMREEILREGILADKFLARDPDVPTFGINLACAWPFPEAWREPHAELAAHLTKSGPWLYVYPHAFTHITLVTFITFSRHVAPSPADRREMESLIEKIVTTIEPALKNDFADGINSFKLQPRTLVLARAAGILPLENPDGQVQRLRDSVLSAVRSDEALHRELAARGLNVPGIIHSTLLRFTQPPPDVGEFLARFDEAANAVKFPPIRVQELLLTAETRPYMRGGSVVKRFPLAGN
jgi:hypothetical protein